ncbi:hypothetical protein [Aestuariicoccus sp. MJ-SS9]|uniref:hypothetical protein n=1 Tax=Aestuariicoccus sp. MJ-SS9 TaxID=3079855 RepID=UPI0029139FE9|nr:hypothetical protein [Aestuariicoccus sp. MJ-SS9]MDU8910049.1 hypothetical protein [Aestuariicoccus sp. MJ-SS9]
MSATTFTDNEQLGVVKKGGLENEIDDPPADATGVPEQSVVTFGTSEIRSEAGRVSAS